MKLFKPLFASCLSVYAIAACSASSSQPGSTDSAQDAHGSSSSSSSGVGSGSGSSSGSSGGDDLGPDASVSGNDDATNGDDGGLLGRVVTGNSCAVLDNTQTSFVPLAPPMLTALDKTETDPVPGDGGTVPAGWNFHNISGAMCRDGSPMGIYVRYGSVNKLMIYLEGGGACMSPHFCDHNPKNMNEVFPGGSLNGESFNGSLLTVAGLQAPYTDGIFDDSNADNPFQHWNEVYIPYCTGDAHFGTNDGAMAPDGVNPFQTNNWHFVGYLNMQKFIGHLVPTFPAVDQVVMTGSSAGGLGAGLNYGMVQDAFGKVPVRWSTTRSRRSSVSTTSRRAYRRS